MNMKCGIKRISDTLIADKKKLSFLKQGAIKKQWLWRGSVTCLLNAHFDFNIQEKKTEKQVKVFITKKKILRDLYEEHKEIKPLRSLPGLGLVNFLWLDLFLFCLFFSGHLFHFSL